MKNLYLLLALLLFTTCATLTESSVQQIVNTIPTQKADYAIVIHGGAGTIKKENMSAEKEKAYHDKLNEALTVGENILKNGGTAADAVCQTIMVMENSPLFNAGKGAVLRNNLLRK